MKKFPNTTRYSRPHKIKTTKGLKAINFNRYKVGLRQLSSKYLSYEHFESSRRVVNRLLRPKNRKNTKNVRQLLSASKIYSRKKNRSKSKRKKLLLMRSNLTLPITKKPLQVRMGKGKGGLDKWVHCSKRSRIIYEMSNRQMPLSRLHSVLFTTGVKLPVKTKLTYSRKHFRRETQFTKDLNLIKILANKKFNKGLKKYSTFKDDDEGFILNYIPDPKTLESLIKGEKPRVEKIAINFFVNYKDLEVAMLKNSLDQLVSTSKKKRNEVEQNLKNKTDLVTTMTIVTFVCYNEKKKSTILILDKEDLENFINDFNQIRLYMESIEKYLKKYKYQDTRNIFNFFFKAKEEMNDITKWIISKEKMNLLVNQNIFNFLVNSYKEKISNTTFKYKNNFLKITVREDDIFCNTDYKTIKELIEKKKFKKNFKSETLQEDISTTINDQTANLNPKDSKN